MAIDKITKSPTPTELVGKVNVVIDRVNNMSIGAMFVISTTAPTDTSVLWINSSPGQNTLNYHNGTTWVPITGVYA